MSISLNDFSNEIKTMFFKNLNSIENIGSFGLANRSLDTLSKTNCIWLLFAKEIGCPIPDPGPKGFKDYEVRNLTKDFIAILLDHIGYYEHQYYNTFNLEPENIQLESLSIENINRVQKKIEILDIFSIWKKLITILSSRGGPATRAFFDSSKLCDYNYSISLFNEWIKENQTELSSLRDLTFFSISLRSIPKALYMLDNLKRLNLSYNYIIDLPDELSLLKNLEELNLKGNELTFVPKCLFDLPRLKKLFLAKNPLHRSAESLKGLKKKNIEVDLNKIEETQIEFDKEGKKLILLMLSWMTVLLAVIYILQNQKSNEEI
ncbi:MAG: hypothetical protein K1060chlam3_00597 [Candidatus Anoxychlamydiales bacterium]|nr:hypothetical protein [Candidatus Anoxychlamydiales bacterium]